MQSLPNWAIKAILLRLGVSRPVALEVESLSSHTKSVFRLRAQGVHAGPLSVIVKITTSGECRIHRLLSESFPEIVPAVRETVYDDRLASSTSDGHALVLDDVLPGGSLENIRRSNGNAGHACKARLSHSRFLGALSSLAKIHARFVGAAASLQSHGLRSKNVTPDLGDVALGDVFQSVNAIQNIFDLSPMKREIAELTKIKCELTHVSKILERPAAMTVIHGDFHPGNLLLDEFDRVWITDWGAAGLQLPAWDLVMCGEREIAHYLESFGDIERYGGIEHFFAQFRAAVLCRMYFFVRLIVRSACEFPDFLEVLPLCVGRLISATEPGFRGGQPLRWRRG
jgi:serine/threonine protein kinase